jgi:hypothetical protein
MLKKFIYAVVVVAAFLIGIFIGYKQNDPSIDGTEIVQKVEEKYNSMMNKIIQNGEFIYGETKFIVKPVQKISNKWEDIDKK